MLPDARVAAWHDKEGLVCWLLLSLWHGFVSLHADVRQRTRLQEDVVACPQHPMCSRAGDSGCMRSTTKPHTTATSGLQVVEERHVS